MTERRLAANRKNALKSTGPKTPAGKKRTRLNALKHGLRAVSLAVPVLENPADWTAHHDQVVRDLSPVGYLETLLAERAAALLWRLGRVVRYESEMVSLSIIERETKPDSYGEKTLVILREELSTQEGTLQTLQRVRNLKASAKVSAEDASLVLDEACGAFGVDPHPEGEPSAVTDPPGFPSDLAWEEWDGWTRGAVDLVLHSIRSAADEYLHEVDPWEWVKWKVSERLVRAKTDHDTRAAAVDEERRERLIPDETTLNKVSRYEAHLERSFFRTLHELQRLQAARSGMVLPPPAAVDLDVSVHGEAS